MSLFRWRKSVAPFAGYSLIEKSRSVYQRFSTVHGMAIPRNRGVRWLTFPGKRGIPSRLAGRGIGSAARNIWIQDFIAKSCFETLRRKNSMDNSGRMTFLITLAATSILLTLGLAGCEKTDTQDPSAQSQPAQTDSSQDPAAAANLAPSGETQAAGSNDPQDGSSADGGDGDEDTSYGQPVLQAQEAPPPLPEYSQPECPGDGYLWTPGYWSYAPQGYYWVPGAWARPPEVGYLWTPGYWGFSAGRYRYNYGSWGQHIGFYGGINYGFGYVGVGYQGGYWSGGRFNYNRSVNNITITNVHVYNRTVTNTVINNTTINTTTTNRASYNGPGGISRKPLPVEIVARREQRIPPMTTQLQQRQEAGQNHQQFASANNGRPAILAATKPIPEGKPIAPVVAARPASALRSAPASAQPNRSEPAPGRPVAAKPAEKSGEPTRKEVQPAPSAAKPAAPERRTAPSVRQPSKPATPPPAAHKPATPPPAAPKPAPTKPAARPADRKPAQPSTPKPQSKPVTPPTSQKPPQHPAPKPKTPPPPPKKEPPADKPNLG